MNHIKLKSQYTFIACITWLVLISCSVAMVHAEDTPVAQSQASETPSAPKVYMTDTDVLDFGYIESGSSHKGQFIITNTSEDTWLITDTRVQCNCTKIIDYPRIIYPGESATMDIQFDAPKIYSSYSKKLYLTVPESEPSTITLKVAARIGLPLSIEPVSLDLQSLMNAEDQTVYVTIRNDGDTPAQLVYATSDIPGCIARIPRTPVEPNGALTIPVTYKAVELSSEQKAGSIKIHTLHEKQRILKLPIVPGTQDE